MSKVETTRGEVWTIVVSAGSGTRFGGEKHLRMLGNQSLLDWSVQAAKEASDGVVLVLAKDQRATADVDSVVVGGSTRAASVRAGLGAVPATAKVICVHDAARPLASAALFDEVIHAVLNGAQAAIPATPVVDTVKRVSNQDPHLVVSTLDRSTLVAVQTPQAFEADVLRQAHESGGEGTDDASLVEQLGGKVVVVAGDPKNLKITVPGDLTMMDRSMQMKYPKIRVGHGYDVHAFSENPERKMLLGGIHFEGVRGLKGHSDADVLTHAIIDALLSATGNGDIGERFPDTDEQFAGANSVDMLREVALLLSDSGWVVHNVDCTVVAEEPKLAPRRQEMQDLLANVVGGQVSVKGKRAEGLGAIGRAEGVACWAVALVAQEIPE